MNDAQKMNETGFEPHDLIWTPEKIARFFDYASQHTAEAHSFSFQVGDALVRLAQNQHALETPALDYGAGVGYLVERLAQAGIRCSGCDFSKASVESLKKRMAGHPLFEDCYLLERLPSGLPDGFFGTVFLVEVLEHLLPEWRTGTLREIWRVLRPGGYAIVTVPHAEPLDLATVMCADCGAVFHRVQHVAAFDATALSMAMADHGFLEILCRPMNLGALTDAMVRQNRRIQTRVRRWLTRLNLLAPHPESTPHLVYIGKKI